MNSTCVPSGCFLFPSGILLVSALPYSSAKKLLAVIMYTNLRLGALLLSYLPFTHASNTTLQRDNITYSDIIRSSVGALLFKDDMQTSCEVVPIDTSSGFVSANCLDFANGKVSTGTEYRVYIDNNKITPQNQYTVEKIHIHPSYDSNSFANNIAVLEYNTQADRSWTNVFSQDRSSWQNISFIRRSIRDTTKPWWFNPALQTHKDVGEDACGDSGLFRANPAALVCGRWMVSSIYNKTCSMPYSSVTAYTGGNLAIAALYSHTATRGSDMCTDTPQYSYYTVLVNYFAFARSVLDRTPGTLVKRDGTAVDSTLGFKMNVTGIDNSPGVAVYGGDLYRLQNATATSTDTSSPVPLIDTAAIIASTTLTTQQTAPTGTTSAATMTAAMQPPTQQPASDTDDGLTRKDTIIIATVVPILSIILIVLLVFAYRAWKRRSSMASEGGYPLEERQSTYSRIIVDDRTAIRIVPDQPPQYGNRGCDTVVMSTPFTPYFYPEDEEHI
ncbi:hypothetical protein GQ54DRAFT_322880 [Martensiomyces pterosporus]|nr:hypothetical protein GQ54DRAFT_322880 [Martensiomyces pterosporus]